MHAYNNSNDYNGYTDSSLDNQLRLISRLIKGDLGSKIYMVTLGFDTHGNQTDIEELFCQAKYFMMILIMRELIIEF